MNLSEIYLKEIDRDIKGVVKVGQDDSSNIYQELEEYVVTEELANHIATFFENYKKGIDSNTDKMGVWISGFFGSGKSHFLKILSYLLQNKIINEKSAVDFFDDKIKDINVLKNIQKTKDITTDIALFNIENKSESNQKDYKDAILRVFNKVFDEMQGFCGSLGWISDLERQLVKDGLYEEFKMEFEKECGSSWVDSREDVYYEEDSVVNTLIKVRGISEESARNWFNKAEENYSISIEKFAKRVNEYIESKGENHHVVFLVDEIGQYIGDDTKLMLNLQGIVEELGTACFGKCWVIVTSQQIIDSISDVKGNDFSKIQGRFNTRLKLSSGNVDEVIKKRLLAKKESSIEDLKSLYKSKNAIIKNLITFKDSAEMKVYKDEKDFVETYPFIPYQFNLLQKIFQGIRGNAASEKHMSEGERSLLGSFQETAIKFMNSEVGVLIPFSAFYETIKNFLDGNIKSVIIQAEKNENLNEYDVEVLKLLFLLKYVKEIKANIENLTTLMVSNIDDDKIQIKENIEKSIKRLIKETLIQENGEEYIFLANDEQDVNREIKKQYVDPKEIKQKLGDIIFNSIYTKDKFRYPSTKSDFIFSKFIDDDVTIKNSNTDIGIKIISPYNDLGVNISEAELRNKSYSEKNLIIKIDEKNISFMSEIEESLQIEQYIRSSIKGTPNVELIKDSKRNEKNQRIERATTYLQEALKHSKLYVNGSIIEIKEKDASNRLDEGIKNLIDIIYYKFFYIKKSIDSVSQIEDILNAKDNQQDWFKEDDNKNAIDEVYKEIEENHHRNISITIKSLITTFENAPYGWNELDIIEKIAKLFKIQKIRLEYSGENLNGKDTINYITKKAYIEKVKVKIRKSVDEKKINEAKKISKDVFFKTITENDEDSIIKEFKQNAQNELYKIRDMLSNYKIGVRYPYPEKEVLTLGENTIKEIISINDSLEFFDRVYSLKYDFYDYGEDCADVINFFKDKQIENFDSGLKIIKNFEENKEYVNDDASSVIDEIKSIITKKRPYNDIQKIPQLIEDYNSILVDLIEEETQKIYPILENCQNEVISLLSEYSFKEKLYKSFNQKFEELKEKLDKSNNFIFIASIPSTVQKIKENCISEINKEIKNQKPKEENNNKVDTTIKTTKQKNIYKSTLINTHTKIKDEEDVKKLVNNLRQKLLKELEDNDELIIL